MKNPKRFTHNIPTSRKRKKIASSSGNAWIYSTVLREIKEARRNDDGMEQ